MAEADPSRRPAPSPATRCLVERNVAVAEVVQHQQRLAATWDRALMETSSARTP